MTTIRVASLLAGVLYLVAGCGGPSGSAVGGASGYNSTPSANDPAIQGMDHYLNGDFQGALDSCQQLQGRDMSTEEMQYHVRGCLALRPAIYLLAGDHNQARDHITAGCESAPQFGHDKDHFCAFVVFFFSVHATDEQFVAADKVLADTFLMECGVSVSEINTIIDEMKAAMEQQIQQQGAY
ncbi:MAG: hypothetical protein JRF63_07150 [Deltaproteobacteria bacterium]|nr:hypothetical protein [Deltaproteobacteria bacterium]